MQKRWAAFAQEAIAIKKQDTQLRGKERQLREEKPEESAVDVWVSTGRKDLLHTSIDELLLILQPHLSSRTALAIASDEWEAYCTSVRNHPAVFHRWFEAHEPDRLMPPGKFTQTVFANANLRNLLDNQFYLAAEAEVPFPRMLVRMRDSLITRLKQKRPRESDAKHAALEANEDSRVTLIRLTHTEMYAKNLGPYFEDIQLKQAQERVTEEDRKSTLKAKVGREGQMASIATLRSDIKTAATTKTVAVQKKQRNTQRRIRQAVRMAVQKVEQGDNNWDEARPAVGAKMAPDDDDDDDFEPLLPFAFLGGIQPTAKAQPAIPGRPAESKEEHEKAESDRSLSVSILAVSTWLTRQKAQLRLLEMEPPPEEELKRMLRADYVENGWNMFLGMAEKNRQGCVDALLVGEEGPLLKQLDLLVEEYDHDLTQARHTIRELTKQSYRKKEDAYVHYLAHLDVMDALDRVITTTRKLLEDKRIKDGMRVAREHLLAEIATDHGDAWPLGSHVLAYFQRRDAVLRAMDLAQTRVVLIDEKELTFDERLSEYDAFLRTDAFVSAHLEATTARDAIANQAPPGAPPGLDKLYLDWTVDQGVWLTYRHHMKTEYDQFVASLGVSDHRLLPGIVLKPATDLLVDTRESRAVTFRQVLFARVALERARLLS